MNIVNIIPLFFGRITVQDDFVLTCIIALSAFASVVVIIYVCWYTLRWAAARGWISVSGYIIEFKEIVVGYGSGSPKIKIYYEYSINGIKFEGNKYQLGLHSDRPSNVGMVQSLRTINSRDKVIEVFVDPSNPTRSSLNIEFDAKGVALLIGIALLALSPLIIF